MFECWGAHRGHHDALPALVEPARVVEPRKEAEAGDVEDVASARVERACISPVGHRYFHDRLPDLRIMD